VDRILTFKLGLISPFLHIYANVYRFPSTVTKTNLAAAIIKAFPNLRSDGALGYVSMDQTIL